MKLLTNEIRTFVATRDWPKGLAYLLEDKGLFIQFVLFRDNFNQFDGEDQLHIAKTVKEIMEKIRGMGVPCYLEVAKGDGLAK